MVPTAAYYLFYRVKCVPGNGKHAFSSRPVVITDQQHVQYSPDEACDLVMTAFVHVDRARSTSTACSIACRQAKGAVCAKPQALSEP